jgi:hypothetical protein
MATLTGKVGQLRSYIMTLPPFNDTRMVYAYVFELAGVGFGYDGFILDDDETYIVCKEFIADMELLKDLKRALPVCLPRDKETEELRGKLKEVIRRRTNGTNLNIVTIVGFLLDKTLAMDNAVEEAHRLHPEWRPEEIETAVKICNELHEICDKIPNVK